MTICLNALPVIVKQRYAFHSPEQLAEEVTLIGGVDCVAFEAETEQERVDTEDFLDLRQHYDAAAAACGNRLYAVNLGDGAACSLVGAAADGDEEAVAALAGSDFYLDGFGGYGLEVLGEQFCYL